MAELEISTVRQGFAEHELAIHVVLTELLRASAADFAAFVPIVRTRRASAPFIHRVVALGDRVDGIRALGGQRLDQVLSWDLLPTARRFEWFATEAQASAFRDGALAEAGCVRVLGTCLVSGDRLVGLLIAGFRTESSEQDHALRRCRRAREGWVNTLLETAPSVENCRSGALYYAQDGVPPKVSSWGDVWLYWPGLDVVLQAMSDNAGLVQHSLPGAVARTHVIRGEREGGVVLILDAAYPPRLPPVFNLSRRQRRIARLAGCGATASEISRDVQVSVETVRSHLKLVYQEFKVRQRTELSRRIGPLEGM